jgi:hypothetical protein
MLNYVLCDAEQSMCILGRREAIKKYRFTLTCIISVERIIYKKKQTIFQLTNCIVEQKLSII